MSEMVKRPCKQKRALFLFFCILLLSFLCFGGIEISRLIPASERVISLEDIPVNLSSTLYYQDPDTGVEKLWYTLKTAETRYWIPYREIPQDFVHAFVAIEDERFFLHHGVDWKRTAAASAYYLLGNRSFGGSTITQQLIKNVTQEHDKTAVRKIREIVRALELEKHYSKQEILEWYLNYIYFGHGQYGINAASQYYFGKSPSDLTLAEMCTIAAITNNPAKYDPYTHPEANLSRRKLILAKMLDLEYIDSGTYAYEIASDISLLQEHTNTEVYPYYVDTVIEDVILQFQQQYNISRSEAESKLYHGGYQIYTNVDIRIQQKMDAVYQDINRIPKTSDVQSLQSSMVILDPFTGKIVGIEGGVGAKTIPRGLNWATSIAGRRPPGSALKPLSVYGLALEKGLITPNTIFHDTARSRLRGTSWYPQNYSRRHYGAVTVRKAVTSSLNTIAAQIVDILTPAESYQFLTETLHLPLDSADNHYAPLALGQLTYGVTARDVASAYSIFPTNGSYRAGQTFDKIIDRTGAIIYQVNNSATAALSSAAAYWMTDMLKDVVSYGTGRAAKLDKMPCAGKTGTTTDSKDLWFVGYTPYYVGAVWTGYESPATIHASKNPAAVIWKSVMEAVHDGLEVKSFEVPEDTTLKKKDTSSTPPNVTPKTASPANPITMDMQNQSVQEIDSSTDNQLNYGEPDEPLENVAEEAPPTWFQILESYP